MSQSELPIQFLGEEVQIAIDELLAASGLARAELVELVEIGVFQPGGAGIESWQFSSGALVLARRAARLRDDFGLNTAGIALALTFIERIEELEYRLRELECHLPGR